MKKTEITKRCKSILHGYPVRSYLPKNDDFHFLINLFKSHPHYELKYGSGIKELFIDFTKYKNKCFNITRTDGTTTDISYVQCLSPSTEISDIKAACRSAIRSEIISFRNQNVDFGKTPCSFTGDILTPENTHIDHYDKTFNVLFSEWYLSKDHAQLFAALNDTSAHGEMEIYFRDISVAEDFRIYHNANTNLRAVSIKANLSILK